MSYVFLALMLVALISLIIGLVKPRLVMLRGEPTRTKVATLYAALLVVGFIGFGATAPSPAPEATTESVGTEETFLSRAELQEKAGSLFAKKQAGEQLLVEKVESGFVKGEVRIEAFPGIESVKRLGLDGAEALVKALMQQGHNPYEEKIFVSCWVKQPSETTSPTGQDQIRGYGRGYYDYNADTIQWEGP